MVAINADVMRRATAAVDVLSRIGTVRAAYIFGSYVDGRADQWSDIDVAAFIDGIESLDLWQRAGVIARVQKEVGFDIEPHLFRTASFDTPSRGSFAAYVIDHGIRIDEAGNSPAN
ncbi:MAG: nucleotidyltransferase domain-containing protein [Planctomycetes bacterium]|nr:nucleotidyltransferase domain-containing protein [Planctomycetota bacterium]